MQLRVISALYLLLVPLLARAAPPEVRSQSPILETVGVREHHDPTHGRGLELTFKRLAPDPALARFSAEDARAFIEALEAALQVSGSPSGAYLSKRIPVEGVVTVSLLGAPPAARSPDLERQLRADYEELFGPSPLPLLSSLESSRWFLAHEP